jgi:hypothetical protein
VARKAGKEVTDETTRAEASMKIDELRERTGVGEAPKEREAGKASAAGPFATRPRLTIAPP